MSNKLTCKCPCHEGPISLSEPMASFCGKCAGNHIGHKTPSDNYPTLDAIANVRYITLRFKCGHSVLWNRPSGIMDPLDCLCIACHPEPVAHKDKVCFECELMGHED